MDPSHIQRWSEMHVTTLFQQRDEVISKLFHENKLCEMTLTRSESSSPSSEFSIKSQH